MRALYPRGLCAAQEAGRSQEPRREGQELGAGDPVGVLVGKWLQGLS